MMDYKKVYILVSNLKEKRVAVRFLSEQNGIEYTDLLNMSFRYVFYNETLNIIDASVEPEIRDNIVIPFEFLFSENEVE